MKNYEKSKFQKKKPTRKINKCEHQRIYKFLEINIVAESNKILLFNFIILSQYKIWKLINWIAENLIITSHNSQIFDKTT
jgi:hypothetical protein